MPIELVKKLHAVGSVAETIEYYSSMIDAGAKHFIINPCASPNVEKDLELFAEKVMPELKKT